MKCPFCHSELVCSEGTFTMDSMCTAEGCINDDMPRIILKYNKATNDLIAGEFMLADLYVAVDYKQDYTVISKLEACVLFDSVQIPKALDIDLNNPNAILPKIRTLMIFS